MADEIFVDTSGFYALLMQKDGAHKKMISFLDDVRAGKSQWVTTDYILDESATLLLARGCPLLAKAVLNLPDQSQSLDVEWMDSVRFSQTRNIFIKYMDQTVSFTDCFSFCLMRERGLQKALTKDKHFEYAGFDRLLPN